jgi:hypothetical protein
MSDDLIRQYADLIASVHEYARSHREHPPALCFKLDVLVNALDQRYGKDEWLSEAAKAIAGTV